MSNEALLAIVGALLSLVGAVSWRLWDGQAREVSELEQRVRKLETEGGEPMRQLRAEFQRLDDKLDRLTAMLAQLSTAVTHLQAKLDAAERKATQ